MQIHGLYYIHATYKTCKSYVYNFWLTNWNENLVSLFSCDIKYIQNINECKKLDD